MLYRNTAGYIDSSMVVIATGAAFTAGSVYAYVQRASDSKWLQADLSWNAVLPVGGNIPTMTHVQGGLWKLAHTPADANDTYFVNCIDSTATCYPDNYEVSVLNQIQATLSSGVTVLPSQVALGVLSATTILSTGSPHIIRRGDAHRLSFSLGATFAKSGGRFYFCVKSDPAANNTTAIVNRETTITDAALVDGYIDLTAAETVTKGMYYAEIERRDADGTSNPLSCWEGVVVIKQDVRQ